MVDKVWLISEFDGVGVGGHSMEGDKEEKSKREWVGDRCTCTSQLCLF